MITVQDATDLALAYSLWDRACFFMVQGPDRDSILLDVGPRLLALQQKTGTRLVTPTNIDRYTSWAAERQNKREEEN